MDKKRRSSQAADELYAQWTQELEQVGIPNQSLEKLRAIWAKNCQVQAEFFEATVGGEEEEAMVEQDEESTTTLGVNEQEEEDDGAAAAAAAATTTTIVLDDEEINATMVAWSGLDEAMLRGDTTEEDEIATMRTVVLPKDTMVGASVVNETATVQTRYSSAQIEEACTRLLSIWDAEDEHVIGADAQGMRKSLLAMQKKCAKRREVEEEEESEQVIQPIHVSAHGTAKFLQNQIVADMIQMVSFGDIVTKFERGQYKEHEYFQLLQLLGWPISLFQQLSCVRQNPAYLAKVLAKAEAVCQN